MNPPVIFNRFKNNIQFWDGRAANLSEQAYGPLFDHAEMNSDPDIINKYLNNNDSYKQQFLKVFKKLPSLDLMIETLVEFEKTLLFGNSRYDQFKAGNITVLSNDEKIGMNLFFNKFKCQNCHSGNNFTNDSIEVRCYPKDFITLSDEDLKKIKKFKVPTLRNLIHSAPYLHDGNLSTIEDVIDFYNDSGIFNKEKKTITEVVKISKKEKAYLVKFLKTLTELDTKKGSLNKAPLKD